MILDSAFLQVDMLPPGADLVAELRAVQAVLSPAEGSGGQTGLSGSRLQSARAANWEPITNLNRRG